VGFAKVTRDLTERRNLEESRLRSARAEEGIRVRDEFLSIASHELRTPLTTMLMQLQGLQLLVQKSAPSIAPRFDRAVRAGKRLSRLVDSLLDVPRMASGGFTLQRERFDLVEAVGQLVHALLDTTAHANRRIEFAADGPVVGEWDRSRIEQVVSNLLDNAVKYSEGAEVVASVFANGEDAVIVVSDGGPGIPDESLARIFGKFERAASTSHYGGLGLGLYVAQQIVEAHRGSIRAFNKPDGGATIAVRLPLVPPADTEDGAS
jgi:signal transduction histidine kinase